VNESLATIINLREDSAESLAAFLDFQMRRGLKGSTTEQADGVFETVMTFFKSLNDRDKFENCYRSLLAQRLLRHWSVDIQYEYAMVEKLERECGYQFTSKLEGMLTDIKLSDKYNTGFQEHIASLGDSNPLKDLYFEFSIKVLTKSIWPKQNPAICNVTELFSRSCDLFRDFYLNSRKDLGSLNLVWQYNLGTSIIQANLPNITYNVKVSTYQMVILNCFNTAEFLTLREIEHSTDISKEDLVREMHLLLKYKILLKQSEKKQDRDDDLYLINNDLQLKTQFLEVQPISLYQNNEMKQRIIQSNDEERKIMIEAAIVRIMKRNVSCPHNELIQEVILELSKRFRANPVITNQRIEVLIERGFMRKTVDPGVYEYIP